ncbi:MAG: endonuclease/exonuclease/phosphatase family protein [Hyphomicrobiaceae bacterium]|nr:endonuclease/exonuclease/phosphatase family protein [Hyphomicrobiaceae bacterium]
MRTLFGFVRRTIAFGVLSSLVLWAVMAIFAYLGFLVPVFDALNHFQPVWFFGLIILLVLSILFGRHTRLRTTILTLGLIGLVLSAIPLLGEALRARLAVSPRDSDHQTVLVMSHNLFGLNYNMQAVADEIHAYQPDILTLQEYFPEQSGRLHPLIAGDYPYFETCSGGRRASIAIYSKLPFRRSPLSTCPENLGEWDNQVSHLVAEFGGDGAGPAWTLVTTHLNWPLQVSVLGRSDLDFWGRISAMTARKSKEFSDLAEALSKIDTPLMLEGDFNSTPWAYDLNRFASGAGLTRETLNLATFPARWYIRGWRDTLPLLPLDHVFTRGGARAYSVETIAPAGSDHLGLLTELALPTPAEAAMVTDASVSVASL